ncbi:MAG TPA: CYTH domain-containing protein [Desulfobacteraceae bacterium]|nr:class IV adenylate cyclase [Deltaproteobacteria bacterium]RLB97956.1 MAG: adenylate cyclase [Deltaproteobacteria bacterium]HDI59334.1 CYTH domain-containing protein [Desulfobacteraceae bacterium]
MDSVEIEVKFWVPRPEALVERILALGADAGDRVFECNWIFDDPGGKLTARGELLRLRQDTAWRLTYKLPCREDGQFKVRREMETTLADGEVLAAVFRALGLESVRCYEKWRQSFDLDGAHLCLDTLPFGTFLEIEGSGERIQRVAADLGLPWPRRILGTYLDLFHIVADEMRLAFHDITFANFEGLSIDLAAWRHLFEAGDTPAPAVESPTHRPPGLG